ncbi:transposase [Streptomyces canus]|uniref:transposase n=1 Tax=Streptomyces canus TaxID=58343 RepID=UPI0034076E0E
MCNPLVFCYVYGRNGRSSDQFMAALETGRTSWCQLLDAVRLGPDDDVTEITALQVRRVVTDLIDCGQWEPGDADILVIFDAGYDAPRIPVEVLGRMRSDRVMRKSVPVSWISPPQGAGRPSMARSSPSPSPIPGPSRTRRQRRSPTGTAPLA